ncbi:MULTISPECIES: cell envelope integrity protein TolA [unclassified Candidatus Cardinium]|uniref:cell envelope integrity protein TolA n=1 Tax=unclassified Candidatus Cardinium TaxID=2641185 RepID=UPI001FB3AF15|nr:MULTISPECIES: cell envelope integrity protein TolA [unclassified Candidatus Cardinium]
MKNNALLSPNGQSIALSIGLHLLMLGLAYSIRSMPVPSASSGQAYRIGLQSTIAYIPKKHQAIQSETQQYPQLANALENQSDTISKNRLKRSSVRPQRRYQNQPSITKTAEKIPKSHNNPIIIDERGLYKTTKNGTKQTGASLELRGWDWDVVPNPNDTTEESGKIVFEIKVDKNGEIVSIQTIEKTVTPMVEKIYADALRGLTFSKTTDHSAHISTGKVTFILVVK